MLKLLPQQIVVVVMEWVTDAVRHWSGDYYWTTIIMAAVAGKIVGLGGKCVCNRSTILPYLGTASLQDGFYLPNTKSWIGQMALSKHTTLCVCNAGFLYKPIFVYRGVAEKFLAWLKRNKKKIFCHLVRFW